MLLVELIFKFVNILKYYVQNYEEEFLNVYFLLLTLCLLYILFVLILAQSPLVECQKKHLLVTDGPTQLLWYFYGRNLHLKIKEDN